MAGISAASWDAIANMIFLSFACALAGAFLGGFVVSVTSKVWDRIADRLAAKLDAKRAEQVQRLQAECFRLRRRASQGGV